MPQTVVERALRIRILTGFSSIILLTLLIAGWSFVHISALGDSVEHLFIANYRSIQYANAMEESIMPATDHSARAIDTTRFRTMLRAEFSNITEPGEQRLAENIQSQFATFLVASYADMRSVRDSLLESIDALRKLNERGMFARSDAAKSEATFAKLSTLGITALLVSIAVLLAVGVSRRSLAEFRELDRAKSNFVATAAHELRNPLSTIKTTTGLLLDGIGGSLTAEQTNLMTSVRIESERLLALVRELLDLARLETGTLRLHPQRIDPYALIESATVPVMMQAERAGVEIDIQVASDISAIVVDPNKVSWAITNLLLNAIRVSPRGGHILVTGSPIDQEVWIAVRDEGRGIAAADRERIFDKFVQVEDSSMGGGSGSGLGLSIAREVIVAHGGRIWVDSERGRGATFTIAIPLKNKLTAQ